MHVTREIINENIKEYLKQIKLLQKLHDTKVISLFFEVLNKKIEEKVIKKTSFNKIIKLTEHYLQNYKKCKSYGFDYDLSNLLKGIIINSGEDSIELHQKISIILRNLILQNSKEKNRGEDFSFYSINTSSGRYWECFITLIDYKTTVTAEEKDFLEKALFKEKYLYSEKLMLFHLGMHTNSMIFRLKNYPWKQNIYKALQDNIQGCEPFLQGFLSYVTYIEAFKSFQKLVLENYQKINLPSDIYRRFLGLLCDIKFRNTFNEESLIEKFESSFKNKEYNKILTILAMPENVKKFDKIRVLEFWKKIILKNLDFDSSFAIVDQYMEPHELLDYYQNLYELMRKKHSSNSEQMPFYFEKFLNKILLVLKQTDEREELTKIYNLLSKAIENTVRFNYKGEIPEILKSLLQEYNKKTTDNVQNNVQNLAIKICQTPGLIQYANLYTNFYLEEI